MGLGVVRVQFLFAFAGSANDVKVEAAHNGANRVNASKRGATASTVFSVFHINPSLPKHSAVSPRLSSLSLGTGNSIIDVMQTHHQIIQLSGTQTLQSNTLRCNNGCQLLEFSDYDVSVHYVSDSVVLEDQEGWNFRLFWSIHSLVTALSQTIHTPQVCPLSV